MKKKSPVAGALEAVGNGALSVEDVLRAAFQNAGGFERWLDRRLKSASSQPSRRQRLYRTKNYPEDIAPAAVSKARELLGRRPDIVSIHWGIRHYQGHATSEPAVVVYVKRKLSPREVMPEDQLPHDVEVSTGSKKYRVRIDVQGAGLPGTLHAVPVAMPGERAGLLIGDDNAVDGSLGALIDIPGSGLHAVLAGHVAEQEGRRVRGQFLDQPPISLGSVVKMTRPPDGDAALAGPVVDDSAQNLLVSPSRSFRDPESSDLTFTVFVHTLRDFDPKPSSIDGIGVTGFFLSGGQTIAIDGLVSLFPQVTNPGDSGGPALDGSGAIVGFVVGGWNGKTYLMPARRAIDELVP
jgi:hypothetical protein